MGNGSRGTGKHLPRTGGEKGLDVIGEWPADTTDGGDFLRSGLHEITDAAEVSEKAFFENVSDSRDVIEKGAGQALLAERTMVLYGKAVSLVADTLQEEQEGGVLVEEQGILAARQVDLVGAVAVGFGEGGDIEAIAAVHVTKDGEGGIQLILRYQFLLY